MSAVSVSGTATVVRSPTGWQTPATMPSRPCASSIRTVSTAYSGMPSARATIETRADSGRPGTSPRSSWRIASVVSGSR